MPCHARMKTMFMRGLLWLLLFGFGYMALSLEPGYLDFDNLPDTNFSCVGKVIGGYYADLETNCQMFHVCTIGQLDEPMDIRFLCLNGTVFDQETRVCERIDEVDCSKSEQFYSLNLELYGNTQPSIVEESPETAPPIIIRSSTSTTTTTTTTTERPKPKTTRPQYFTTTAPSSSTTSGPKVISTHHFPISSAPDIRFNPEEINISLNPGAPPNIRPKPISFQQQIFSSSNDNHHHNNKKAIVTTHINFGDEDKEEVVQVQRPQPTSTTQKPKSVVSYELTHDEVTPSEINYGFTYNNLPEEDEQHYQTEAPPPRNYQYHHSNLGNFRPGVLGQYRNQFRTSTYRNEHNIATTRKHPYHANKGVTTYRNPYISSLKPPPNYHYRTEKPQRLQLPLPLLPTLPPLTFSSPAPFTLSRHIETKRYTNEHQQPPRIIISASASVSDASGRRLNYSLGTIGVAPLLEEPPKSYDDYKDHDVVLDPFYHDVPKVKVNKRRKRSLQGKRIKHSDVIKNEQEAVDVLKFLFDWYKDHEKTTIAIPVMPEVKTEINERFKLSPSTEAGGETSSSKNDFSLQSLRPDFRHSGLFKRGSKYNIIGDVLSVTELEQIKADPSTTSTLQTNSEVTDEDYVDDNYEPLTYQKEPNSNNKISVTKEHTTDNYQKTPFYEENTNAQIDSIISSTPKDNTEEYDVENSYVDPEVIRNDSLGRKPIAIESDKRNNENVNKSEKAISFEGAEHTDDVEHKIVVEVHKAKSNEKDIHEEVTKNDNDEYKGSDDTGETYNSDLKVIDDRTDDLVGDVRPIIDRNNSTNDDNIYNVKNLSIDKAVGDDKRIVDSISATDIEKPTSVDTERTLKEDDKKTERMNVEKSSSYDNERVVGEEGKNSDFLQTKIDYEQKENDYKEQERHKINFATAKDDDTTTIFFIVRKTTPRPKSGRRGRTRFNKNFAAEIDSGKTIQIDATTPVRTTESLETRRTTPPVITTSEAYPTSIEADVGENFEDGAISTTTEAYKEELTTTENVPFVTQSYNDDDHKNVEMSTLLDEQLGVIEVAQAEEKRTENYNFEDAKNTSNRAAIEERHYEALPPKETISLITTESDTPATNQEEENYETTSVYDENRHRITEQTTSIVNNYNDNSEIYQDHTSEFSTTERMTEISTTTIEELNLTPVSVTTEEITVVTTAAPERSTNRRNYGRRGRPSRYKTNSNYNRRRPNARHRFSTEQFTSRPSRRKPIVEEEIIDVITAQLTTTKGDTTVDVSTSGNQDERVTTTKNFVGVRTGTTTTDLSQEDKVNAAKILDIVESTDKDVATTSDNTERILEDVPATDAPLYRSANPTQAESAKQNLHTTPLSMVYRVQVKKEKLRSFVFNCFGKPINNYYSDPRDCRLFHYCTSGYTKNQLLDMKFVCDLGTYFDDEKLICTKTKPARCL